MKFVMFYHSFASCWNHGNAHFLRGIARELLRLGHEVVVYEPVDGWSRSNALQDGGGDALAEAARLVPGVALRTYDPLAVDLDEAVDRAQVVLVHEWNDPELVARIGDRRRDVRDFLLLFHDTHHRAATAPHEIARFELDHYDAVLVFGEVLRQVYQRLGWGRRVFTWHEAADVALFRPWPDISKDTDLVWIGNWGDGERDRELQEFMIGPAMRAGLKARIHGVRYPDHVRQRLHELGIEFGGWLPNHCAPQAFARAKMTMHVPRRPYVEALPGIPTIRVFEALACGIPLISAPWDDAEGLFTDGSFLKVKDGAEAGAALRLLASDPALAAETSRIGLQAIHERHTCAHRARELLAIVGSLQPAAAPSHAGRARESEWMAVS
jgi:spore maturation protein CgeB